MHKYTSHDQASRQTLGGSQMSNIHNNKLMTGPNCRQVDVVVISDTHLGTYECHAKELLDYLNSINPRILVLNVDIIDFWAGKKWTWRRAHTSVIKRILELAVSGTMVHYVIGNHDEGLRKLPTVGLGNFNLSNDLALEINNHKIW